jgi:TfoX/Sxy family transcriptional regulator of competence genes
MAYDEFLGERISNLLRKNGVKFEEKRMMGGLAHMVDGKMCVGVVQEKLMVRIDPEMYETALSKKGCRPMDFTGRPMKGFVFVGPEGIDDEEQLEYWIAWALEFNPRAKSSKK